jgi:hypothetical protein
MMSGSVGTVDQDLQLLQGDLAKVNLLRIRGDLGSAKTLCLSVLKRYPESVDAHVMMGDLHSEQAELAPAAEWYSLALDLDSTAPGVAVKLARVQAAVDISKQASTSRALIQTGKRISPLLYVASGAAALSIGTIAYVVGLRNLPTQYSGNSIKEKIAVPVNTPTMPVVNNLPQNNAVTLPRVEDSSPTKTPVASPSGATEKSANKSTIPTDVVAQDQTLFDQIYQRTTFSKHLISILSDPRNKSMILTFNVKEGEHGRYIGAVLADVAMEYDTKANLVTLRGVRNGILSYMGDVSREKIIETEADAGKDVKDIEDKGWIDKVLTNEYFRDREVTKSLPM